MINWASDFEFEPTTNDVFRRSLPDTEGGCQQRSNSHPTQTEEQRTLEYRRCQPLSASCWGLGVFCPWVVLGLKGAVPGQKLFFRHKLSNLWVTAPLLNEPLGEDWWGPVPSIITPRAEFACWTWSEEASQCKCKDPCVNAEERDCWTAFSGNADTERLCKLSLKASRSKPNLDFGELAVATPTSHNPPETMRKQE
eukprot:493914-Rhodomonas_salina.2